MDADKLSLKRRIQESLARLEQQQLVSRNGDLWFFLTNEERDVARELGHVEVSSSERTRLLSDLIFEEISSAAKSKSATVTPKATMNLTACWTVRPGNQPTTP